MYRMSIILLLGIMTAALLSGYFVARAEIEWERAKEGKKHGRH